MEKYLDCHRKSLVFLLFSLFVIIQRILRDTAGTRNAEWEDIYYPRHTKDFHDINYLTLELSIMWYSPTISANINLYLTLIVKDVDMKTVVLLSDLVHAINFWRFVEIERLRFGVKKGRQWRRRPDDRRWGGKVGKLHETKTR